MNKLGTTWLHSLQMRPAAVGYHMADQCLCLVYPPLVTNTLKPLLTIWVVHTRLLSFKTQEKKPVEHHGSCIDARRSILAKNQMNQLINAWDPPPKGDPPFLLKACLFHGMWTASHRCWGSIAGSIGLYSLNVHFCKGARPQEVSAQLI